MDKKELKKLEDFFIPKVKESVCCICGKKKNSTFVYIGHGKYRHTACEPGTSSWMKSSIGKEGSMFKFFKEIKGEEYVGEIG